MECRMSREGNSRPWTTEYASEQCSSPRPDATDLYALPVARLGGSNRGSC
jgi:hypothetical protein